LLNPGKLSACCQKFTPHANEFKRESISSLAKLNNGVDDFFVRCHSPGIAGGSASATMYPPNRQGQPMTPAPDLATAEQYDRWYDTGWGRYAFTIELAAIQAATGSLPGLRLIDVGCGTGRFTRALADDAESVIGVDRDPAMLSVAVRRLPDVPLVQADINQLPFPAATFDIAVAVCVLEFTSDPAVVVAELARIVRPGGQIVIGVLNPTSPWGLTHGRRFHTAPWTEATFLNRRELRRLAAGHGTARVRRALYAPTDTRFGPVIESIGRRVAPKFGAFQVLTITTNQRDA
jgi:ubiquinone/menaquinone biosynthesis C-methylase UbiE